ncbi:uncharacterized protein DMENIID0001_144210 [Sergentomyia squamirostris]
MLKYLVFVLAVLACTLASPTTIYPCPSTGLERLPHSTSCRHFVQCISGVAVIRECAPGFYFSVEYHECKSPYLAECDIEDHICPLFNDPANLVYLPDSERCDLYHLCFDGEPVQFECYDGLHWDPVNHQCTYPSLANCQNVNVTCPSYGISIIPHPFLCNRFFHCVEGERFPDICPGNLVFDADRWRCHVPDESRCIYWDEPETTAAPTPIPNNQIDSKDQKIPK